MWYLYLDESGDLGFDFVNKKPSKFFTVTILALSGADKNRFLINGVKHTLKRKLNIYHKIKMSVPYRFVVFRLLPTRWKGTPKTICSGLTAHLKYTTTHK